MAHPSFGDGWPDCDRGDIVTIVRSDGLRLPVHRELQDLVATLVDLTELRGYDVRPGQTWGYACRPIAGTSRASNHSWGTAVDINAPSNPRREDRRLVTDLPDTVVDLWTGHGFRWGGEYSWPDPMHFEFMDSTGKARTVTDRLARFLSGQTSSPTPRDRPDRPTRRPYPGVARMGDRGPSVEVWQQTLVERGYRIDVDGIYGPATNHVVVDWQRKHGLEVDGVGGPNTWHSLLFA